MKIKILPVFYLILPLLAFSSNQDQSYRTNTSVEQQIADVLAKIDAEKSSDTTLLARNLIALSEQIHAQEKQTQSIESNIFSNYLLSTREDTGKQRQLLTLLAKLPPEEKIKIFSANGTFDIFLQTTCSNESAQKQLLMILKTLQSSDKIKILTQACISSLEWLATPELQESFLNIVKTIEDKKQRPLTLNTNADFIYPKLNSFTLRQLFLSWLLEKNCHQIFDRRETPIPETNILAKTALNEGTINTTKKTECQNNLIHNKTIYEGIVKYFKRMRTSNDFLQAASNQEALEKNKKKINKVLDEAAYFFPPNENAYLFTLSKLPSDGRPRGVLYNKKVVRALPATQKKVQDADEAEKKFRENLWTLSIKQKTQASSIPFSDVTLITKS